MQVESAKTLTQRLGDTLKREGSLADNVADLETVARQAYGDSLLALNRGDETFAQELATAGLALVRRAAFTLYAAANERNYLELQAKYPVSDRRALLMSNTIEVVSATEKNYFGHCGDAIKDFLGMTVKSILHIPFASVGQGAYDASSARAAVRFAELGYEIVPIQKSGDERGAINKAEAVFVSGGNTHHLMHELLCRGLLPALREKVFSGTPYMGSSAGANVAFFTIGASNDWRWRDVPLTNSIGIVPGAVILNPHRPADEDALHGGETREERARELLRGLSPDVPCFPRNMPAVLTLSEGVWVKLDSGRFSLLGKNRRGQSAEIFYEDGRAVPLSPEAGGELDRLLS